MILLNANKILRQSVFCHFALRVDDHLKPFGHGIRKEDEVGGVKSNPEFFQFLLQIIDVTWSRFLNFIF